MDDLLGLANGFNGDETLGLLDKVESWGSGTVRFTGVADDELDEFEDGILVLDDGM